MSLILCRFQSKAAQHDFECQTRGDVAQERLARLPANAHRRNDLIDGPPFRVSRELASSVWIDEKATRRLGLRQQQVATVEPVGVDQPLRLLALEPVGAPEQRVHALRADLGEQLERLRARRGRAGVGPRPEADDLAAREQGRGNRARPRQDQDDHGRGGRLLQGLEERLRRVVRHPLGLVEDEHLAARHRRPQRCEPLELADRADPDRAGAALARSSSANARAVVMRPAPAGPMKAYAWATRSLASARRSSSTARGWSRMRSSATKEFLDDRAHLGLDDVRRRSRADQAHALGLGAEDPEIAAAHLAVEGERLPLEVVEAPVAGPYPAHSLGRIEVEEQGEIRHDAAGRARVQLADQVEIDATTVPLVRDRRIGVPIAQHDTAAIEPRPDLLGDVLLARGHEEEDLDERPGLDTRSLEQGAHRNAESCSVGLPRVLDLATLPTKPAPEPHHLGRLARPFDALERDQYTAHAPANLRSNHSTAPRPSGIAGRPSDPGYEGGARSPRRDRQRAIASRRPPAPPNRPAVVSV